MTGTVTLDGAPTEGATVYFAPLEVEAVRGFEEGDARASNGVTDAKGHYQLIYKEGVTGAASGNARVWVALSSPQVALEYSLGALNTKDVEAKSQTIDSSLTSPENENNSSSVGTSGVNSEC